MLGSMTLACTSTQAGGGTGSEGGATTGGMEAGERFVATWTTAHGDASKLVGVSPLMLADQSVRQVAHVSVGGTRARVRLSNVFGASDLEVSAASIALTQEGVLTVSETAQPLQVDGADAFSIPAGEIVITDPLLFEVPALGEVAVSLHLAAGVTTTTMHPEAHQTTWASLEGAGDLVDEPNWPDTTTTASWYWLSGIDVEAPSTTAAVVALGDSITDGTGSTTDANARWPDILAARFDADPRAYEVAVVNAGLGGNCVQRECQGPSALDRFDRDVLDQPGVAWVIVTEGINDIGLGALLGTPTSVDALTGAYSKLIERAHARGLRIYGGTLLPYKGATYYADEGEQIRQGVNDWIRSSGAFDAVVDFDLAVRDPQDPERLAPMFDSGDQLHPNDAGYAAMAAAIDLSLFDDPN